MSIIWPEEYENIKFYQINDYFKYIILNFLIINSKFKSINYYYNKQPGLAKNFS